MSKQESNNPNNNQQKPAQVENAPRVVTVINSENAQRRSLNIPSDNKGSKQD